MEEKRSAEQRLEEMALMILSTKAKPESGDRVSLARTDWRMNGKVMVKATAQKIMECLVDFPDEELMDPTKPYLGFLKRMKDAEIAKKKKQQEDALKVVKNKQYLDPSSLSYQARSLSRLSLAGNKHLHLDATDPHKHAEATKSIELKVEQNLIKSMCQFVRDKGGRAIKSPITIQEILENKQRWKEFLVLCDEAFNTDSVVSEVYSNFIMQTGFPISFVRFLQEYKKARKEEQPEEGPQVSKMETENKERGPVSLKNESFNVSFVKRTRSSNTEKGNRTEKTVQNTRGIDTRKPSNDLNIPVSVGDLHSESVGEKATRKIGSRLNISLSDLELKEEHDKSYLPKKLHASFFQRGVGNTPGNLSPNLSIPGSNLASQKEPNNGSIARGKWKRRQTFFQIQKEFQDRKESQEIKIQNKKKQRIRGILNSAVGLSGKKKKIRASTIERLSQPTNMKGSLAIQRPSRNRSLEESMLSLTSYHGGANLKKRRRQSSLVVEGSSSTTQAGYSQNYGDMEQLKEAAEMLGLNQNEEIKMRELWKKCFFDSSRDNRKSMIGFLEDAKKSQNDLGDLTRNNKQKLSTIMDGVFGQKPSTAGDKSFVNIRELIDIYEKSGQKKDLHAKRSPFARVGILPMQGMEQNDSSETDGANKLYRDPSIINSHFINANVPDLVNSHMNLEKSSKEKPSLKNLSQIESDPNGKSIMSQLNIGPGQSNSTSMFNHLQKGSGENETVARMERKRRWVVKQSIEMYKYSKKFDEKQEAVRNLMGLKQIVVNGLKYTVDPNLIRSLPDYRTTIVPNAKKEKPRNKQMVIK